MTDGSTIVDELRHMIGKEGDPVTIEVERRMIKRFVEAIGDPNPLWRDEQYAQKSRYGGTTAPPMFLCGDMMSFERRMDPHIPFKRVLDAGGEWEFFEPIKPGDRITSTSKLLEPKERKGKRFGRMFFIEWEMTHKNQRGELVARSRGRLAYY